MGHSWKIGVVIATLLGCGDDGGGGMMGVSIPFRAVVGDEAFSCSDSGSPRMYDNLGTGGASASFRDFRFYVSNVRLIDDGGTAVDVILDESQFQYQDVALLDFEDGTGNCIDVGNSVENDVVAGTAPSGNYRGVAFDLGIPFDKNHLEASAGDTPAPLNIMALFWNWQGGHKFARIDLAVAGGTGWNLHLGSTECVSGGPMEAPTTTCGKPNMAHVELPDYDPAVDTIVFDASVLFADSDLSLNADGPPGCQSFPLDVAECTSLYPNLGLSFDTGECTNGCAGQSVFVVSP